jgi:ferric iron reductase protein FhuF
MPVAASQFLQRYAYRLLTPAVIAWITEDVIPDLGLANTRVRYGTGRDLSFTLVHPVGAGPVTWDEGVAWVARRLVEGHLQPVMAELADAFRLNPRPLRMNAAAPLLYTFAVCDRVPALRSRGRGVMDGVLAALFGGERPRLIAADPACGGRLQLLDRRCCCLKHLLPGATGCAECPLLPEADRRARIGDLAGRDELLPDLHPPDLRPGPVPG